MQTKKILFGVPPKAHVLLAQDEITGFQEIGYECESAVYGRNDQSISKINKLFGVLRNAIKLIIKLYKFNPNILYLNSRFEPIGATRDYISILLIKCFYFKKIKIVIKSHGSEIMMLEDNSLFFKKLVIPFLTKQVKAWFFLSTDEKDTIAKLNPKFGRNIYVTANIVDPSRSLKSEKFKKKFNLDSSKFNFLFVGRMLKEKGIFNIVKSIQNLEDRNNYRFTFVGDGPDFQELKTLSSDLKLDDYTNFTGFVPDKECDHFYANADALVYPTYCNEGFPMALFKAVSCGLPIITTQIRAAKDYLTQPNNVLWVDGRSEESIGHAVKAIYNDTQLRANMKENNSALGTNFTRLKVCNQMKTVFDRL